MPVSSRAWAALDQENADDSTPPGNAGEAARIDVALTEPARDRGGDVAAAIPEFEDRRRPSVNRRVPWTADPPYIVREPLYRPDDDPASWRRAARIYQGALMCVDVLITLALVGLAAWLRPLFSSAADVSVNMALGTALITACTLGVAAAMGGYRRITLGDGVHEYQAWLRAVACTFGIAAALTYILDLFVPRDVFVAAVPIVALGWLARYAFRKVLHRRRAGGTAMMRTLLVGDPMTVERLNARFHRRTFHGYQVVGVCSPSYGRSTSIAATGVPVLGAIADIPQVVMDYGIDTVVVEPGHVAGDSLRRLSWAIGCTPAELIVSPGLVEVMQPRLKMRPTMGLSLLHVETENPRLRLWLKATLERVAATVGTLALSPLLLVVMLAIRLDSPGPVFFRQVRVGEGGKEFRIWKFRSMYVDAEARKAALLKDTDRDGPMFKMKRDPRITRVGRFIRRFSIDELPQLFNVITGEMSLIGPRPPLPAEVATYEDAVSRRLLVRPGMTGLWQVSGRADLPWEESVQLDLRYVDNWSFSMDAQILWRTLRAVVGGKGAY